MCGIYGVINRKVRREQAMECLDTMIHRGPDGFGLWQEDGVTLGHRRLAILDLSSAGSQPMSYANERYWMTFNGEIYNLSRSGRNCSTRDTRSAETATRK